MNHTITLAPSGDLTLLADVCAKAAATPRGALPKKLLEVLTDLAERSGQLVVDGDLRATAAGEFELCLGPDLSVAERTLLSAFRAGHFDSHSNPPSLLVSETATNTESSGASNRAAGSAVRGNSVLRASVVIVFTWAFAAALVCLGLFILAGGAP